MDAEATINHLMRANPGANVFVFHPAYAIARDRQGRTRSAYWHEHPTEADAIKAALVRLPSEAN